MSCVRLGPTQRFGNSTNVLLRDHVDVGVLRLLRVAVAQVAHDDLLGRLPRVELVAVEAALLRVFVECAEHERLRRVDGAVVVVAVEVDEAER